MEGAIAVYVVLAATAAAVALATVLVLPAVTCTPLSDWSPAQLRWIAERAAVHAVAGGAIDAVIFAHEPAAAASGGLAGGLTFMAWLALRWRVRRRIEAIARRLSSDASQDAEVAGEMLDVLEAHRPRAAASLYEHTIWYLAVVHGASALADRCVLEGAERVLDLLASEPLEETLVHLRAAVLGTVRILRGDREGAEAALRSVPRDAAPSIAALVEGAEILCDAHAERGARALTRLAGSSTAVHPDDLLRRLAQAHATAGIGAVDRARGHLCEIERCHGRVALERAAAMGGPGAAIAAQILAGHPDRAARQCAVTDDAPR